MVRIAIIDRSKCRAPEKCDYICMRVCPVQKNNIQVFKIGEDKKPIILEEACIGCGICVKKCPFNAIKIINLTSEPDRSPVFQYGPNTFRLYRLPIIKKGEIVAIIGRNGMGKTTAIKILSGLLKPNLGRYNNPPTEKEILEFFKGSELFEYFNKLFKKEITVSYKPQNILLFTKLYGDKKVRDIINKLLENVDSSEIENRVIQFGIHKILDRHVKELSGGELQKLLIFVTAEKQADVYLYDEPTAYLDIYERLKAAIYIRDKVEDRSTVVIDHDLLFLDYVGDTLHIVYGVQKAYGVFSYPIGIREGINQYLRGFIKRENLRIRDKPIDFKIKPFSEEIPDEYIVEWKNIRVDLGGFKLYAEEGSIRKEEIVGIVGRNGIGKTTFAKVLAGLIKYNGELTKNVSVAYKPQYLVLPDEIKYLTVGEFLKSVNPYYKIDYKEYLFDLGISDMLEHEMNTLSGGELQTVLTFATLIQDKDLFLLDEPFAFLDVEQRVRMSKFIREIVKARKKSALIIEHDIMFLDYISDRIAVFLGEPSKYGNVYGPYENEVALNKFLEDVGITLRTDKESGRPRINKPDSYLDRLQKSQGVYFYRE